MLGRVLDARHLTPLVECSIAKKSIMFRFHVVTTNAKKIVDRTVG
jgi:hypothetical protein